VEVIVELASHGSADAWRSFQIFQGSALDRPRRSKVHQQCALPAWTDAGHIIERRSRQALRPLRPVRTDGEAVRFIPEPLEIE